MRGACGGSRARTRSRWFPSPIKCDVAEHFVAADRLIGVPGVVGPAWNFSIIHAASPAGESVSPKGSVVGGVPWID